MSWRAARSLDQLLSEVNAAAPNRGKAADGTIGDQAHAARASDHNPNAAGVVRARDFTHDPEHGCDAGQLAERIRQLGIAGHPALQAGAYVIWNHRIASATLDGAPWDWEPYSGTNGHTHHCHVSVSTAPAGYDSTKKWGVMSRPPKPSKPNHVTAARKLLQQAAGELDQAPAGRKVVHAVADSVRKLLQLLPDR